MRIAIDINEEQIRALDTLSKATQRPRAELIRDAVDQYLAKQLSDVFGLWRGRKVDGLAYQERRAANGEGAAQQAGTLILIPALSEFYLVCM